MFRKEKAKMDKIFKTIVAVAGAIASYLFGGWSSLLSILLAFVVADYITGVIASSMEGKLNSKTGMKGIAKKVFIFMFIAAAHLVDTVLGDLHLFRDATIFFYLANELLSIIENGGRIGVDIPPALLKSVEVLKGKSDIEEGEDNE